MGVIHDRWAAWKREQAGASGQIPPLTDLGIYATAVTPEDIPVSLSPSARIMHPVAWSVESDSTGAGLELTEDGTILVVVGGLFVGGFDLSGDPGGAHNVGQHIIDLTSGMDVWSLSVNTTDSASNTAPVFLALPSGTELALRVYSDVETNGSPPPVEDQHPSLTAQDFYLSRLLAVP